MDPAFEKEWRERARAMWEASRDDGAVELPEGQRKSAITLVDRRIDAFLPSLPPGFSRWGPDATSALSAAFRGKLEDPREGTLLKCVLRGYAYAARDFSVVPPNEMATLPPVPPLPARAPGSPFLLPFAVAYEDPGKEVLRAVGTVAIEEAEADEWPEVARLPFLYREGHVSVRRRGDAWARSVCAPTRGRTAAMVPATMEEFAWACGGGASWLDDPFAPRRRRTTLSVDEVAARQGTGRDAHETARAALARAGGILSIDGTAYRRVDEPVARPVLRHRWRSADQCRKPEVVLWWSSGGMDADALFDHRPEWRNERRPMDLPSRAGMAAALSFPLSQVALAREVASAMADGARSPLVDLLEGVDMGTRAPTREALAAAFREGASLRVGGLTLDARGAQRWAPGATAAACGDAVTALAGLGSDGEVADALEAVDATFRPEPKQDLTDLACMAGTKALLRVAARALRGDYDPTPPEEDVAALLP